VKRGTQQNGKINLCTGIVRPNVQKEKRREDNEKIPTILQKGLPIYEKKRSNEGKKKTDTNTRVREEMLRSDSRETPDGRGKRKQHRDRRV